MIIEHIPYLSGKRIILASQSPRRKEILNLLGLPFEAIPSTFPEELPKSKFNSAQDYSIATAREKAIEVAQKELKTSNPPDLVIGSDTVVVLDGEILEKPSSKDDAIRMLSLLSGRSHTVLTAVHLIAKDYHHSFCEAAHVKFAELSRDSIESYVNTEEPMDKAGSYGIQGKGGAFVSKIDGCFFCVMGLPMHALAREVKKLIEDEVL